MAVDLQRFNRPLEFDGSIQGRPSRFLLDTGAGANFLSAQVAATLGNILLPQQARPMPKAQLPDGTELTCRVTKTLKVQLGPHSEWLTFNVVPLKEFEVILGQPWLHHHRALLNVARGNVVIRPLRGTTVVLKARTPPLPSPNKIPKPHQPVPPPQPCSSMGTIECHAVQKSCQQGGGVLCHCPQTGGCR